MPDLSGLEVVRQVRSIAGKDALIIIMTAYEWTAFEDEAKQAGVSAFCNKPVFLSGLREIMESAIHKSEATAKTSALPRLVTDQHSKRLLVVEDNELNREIAVGLLTGEGFEVETAEDGAIAVEKMKETAPGYYDLILMDVQMPLMNGYEATRAIRALEAGMDDYVSKSINMEVLLDVIRQQLNMQ